ncbi:MAG: glycosyltransferase family 2 protein [Lachnospiraceae bacterium]|nr:glycosyltransferase family 2 protein [Candidatus Darwinimomas equi]
MNKILLIIPAFNEEANIERVVDELIKNHSNLDYVIINDGSTDNTSRICHEKGYNIIDHPENKGLAAAFHTGMKYAFEKGYECCVQFDGDGQHRAEFVIPMKEKMDEGYNIVIASRFIDAKKPVSMRMVGSNMIQSAIRKKTGVDIKDPTSGMRMYDRGLIGKFANEINLPPEPSTLAYLIKNGSKVAEIPAVMDERIGGVSYLTPAQAAKYMVKVLKDIWTNY